MELTIKRIRLKTCLNTIVDVHRSLDQEKTPDEMNEKFEKLKSALNDVKLDEITDLDIERVEMATNQVLKELGDLYSESAGSLDVLGPRH